MTNDSYVEYNRIREEMKMEAYKATNLPVPEKFIDLTSFYDELIDANTKLEVYKEKIRDSKLDSSWFMPTLQQKEALASSALEGTQATLDGVLINQVTPNDKDKNLQEVLNYFNATEVGLRYLSRKPFSLELIEEIHRELMQSSARNNADEVGVLRTKQNYIGRLDGSHEVVFVPPAPEDVPSLMKNLVEYACEPKDKLRPLVRTAIIHAQFLTIHPFMDGNGRVGRILIPLYLFSQHQIDLPCFFVSEALERDKFRYYKLLNDIRTSDSWNAWIKFFLKTVTAQCEKYIGIISRINILYDETVHNACQLVRSGKVVDIINLLYKYPIITAAMVTQKTDLSAATVNRYLNILVENNILYTNQKTRNRVFYYYDLLDILRE